MTDPVSEVQGWDRATLIKRWRQIFGSQPPPHVRTEFLRRALGWQVQMADHPARRSKQSVQKLRRTRRPTPGTRLIRQWQGKTYQVTVTASGFEFEGEPYASLTAIATAITGISWSGPAFFGVKS